jgi:hypothetical protein
MRRYSITAYQPLRAVSLRALSSASFSELNLSFACPSRTRPVCSSLADVPAA